MDKETGSGVGAAGIGTGGLRSIIGSIGPRERAALMDKCREHVKRDLPGDRAAALLALAVLDIGGKLSDLFVESKGS